MSSRLVTSPHTPDIGLDISQRHHALAELDVDFEYFGRLNDERVVDPYLLGAQNAISLLAAAERAREYALSHRQFSVGAAALALYYDSGTLAVERGRLVHGANIKPTQDSEVNIHAEHVLMSRARSGARDGQDVLVPAFAVVGDLQPDQQSGIHTCTLHPCGVCRDAFMQEGSPIGPDSLFVTANSDFTAFEWGTVGELRTLHDTAGSGGTIGSVTFPSRPLALSGNLPEQLESHAQADAQATADSDRLVLHSLQLPIIDYYFSTNESRS